MGPKEIARAKKSEARHLAKIKAKLDTAITEAEDRAEAAVTEFEAQCHREAAASAANLRDLEERASAGRMHALDGELAAAT